MRAPRIIALIVLTAVGVLASFGSAQAGTADSWVYRTTIAEDMGTSPRAIVVNNQTGNLLVMGSDNNLHQLDSSGKPVNFAATGTSTIPISGQIAIANGGGPTQGNFYVFDGHYVHTYHPDGSPIGESKTIGAEMGPGVYDPAAEGLFADECCLITNGGLFVAPDGVLWVHMNGIFGHPGVFLWTEMVAVTPEMAPIGPRKGVGDAGLGGLTPVQDKLGHLYADQNYGQVSKFDVSGGGAFLNYLPFASSEDRQLAVEPTTNDVYLAGEGSTFDANAELQGSVTAHHPGDTATTPPIEVLVPTGGQRRAGGVGFTGDGSKMYVSEGDKIRVFNSEPPIPPWDLEGAKAREIRSRGAVLQTRLIDGNARVTYKFEYGPTASYGAVTETVMAPHKYYSQVVRAVAAGLEPDHTYHFRLVATNSAGTVYGPDGTFKTYSVPPGVDKCPNALARKQTVASRLPDCRGYELASAPYTGGYDVESSLVSGQRPYQGFPYAKDRVLYGTHSGAVPGPWNATNKGPDPYVATRTENGWVTRYEGLPSDLNPAAGPFSSVLGEADPSLSTLAFVGPGLCSPCFGSGLETGIPVRVPDGSLVQGMSGSISGSVPVTAIPEGKVAKYFSGDGKHLVFASKYAFEPGANTSGTDLTVYDRDLFAGTTQIVSTDQAGKALTGTVSELDISADGSRIVTATKVSTDPAGNELVHPYIHLGTAASSVNLAPAATSGVRYAGMTADGSKVFFTTADALVGDDTDTSADLYEATVDGSGNVELSVITGTDSNACNPVSNSNGAHWNTTGATANCDAVAISGGGGVASTSGAIYFLSPEQLESGKGTANQPNLYLAQPGESPVFVATLEPDNPLVLDSVKSNAERRTADFQTTPSGNYAAFTDRIDLTNLPSGGFAGLYRFEAGTGDVNCVSCDLSGTDEAGVFANAELPPNGLALLGDGRLFFTTLAQLLLNDANGRRDVYEFVDGKQELISSGTSPFDSALIGVSADGTDAFFFTHDPLAAEEDDNGSLTRIYDAREFGGFFKLPPSVPCQASDECHGPSSPLPPPSDIKSSGVTTPGNVVICAKNRVKKRGQCVKKANGKKKHQKKKRKRGGRNA
jgi:hypothetical protein